MTAEKKDDQLGDEETRRREDATLKRLLAMPPQPKTKKADKANPPKKRGRPPKKSEPECGPNDIAESGQRDSNREK